MQNDEAKKSTTISTEFFSYIENSGLFTAEQAYLDFVERHEIEQAEIDGDTSKLAHSETVIQYVENQKIITTHGEQK